ncbi:MAG TPA: transcriptional repressor NrdR [Planctomycetaceae bacterium]|nr:transcriptional repressor NrdR [Planctomycetaceae bacterium]
MKCPFCHQDNDRVVDTQPTDGGTAIRRRRHCLNCDRRFTTYERVERHPLRVIKKDGRRVPFDRNRIRLGLEKACEKRPVSAEMIDQLVGEIESEVYQNFDREVPSHYIGERAVERLKRIDHVAYVRFASVYRDFKAASDFVEEVSPLLEDGEQGSEEKRTKR